MVEKEEKQNGKYQYGQNDILGKGSFGVVYKGTYIDDKGQKKVVALKEIPEHILKDHSQMGNLYNEISISSKINEENKDDPFSSSENVVKFFDITNLNDKTFLVYEYCNGGDIRRYLKFFRRFDEKIVQNIISQLLKGLKFLHNKKIVHHDIKPENILVELCVEGETEKEKNDKIKMIMEKTSARNRGTNDPNALKNSVLKVLDRSKFKITDFGLSKFKKETNKVEISGSPLYLDPNSLKAEAEIDTVENEKVDIWAVGVLAYELFFYNCPFQPFPPSINRLKESLKKGEYDIDMKNCKLVSKQFLSFLNACLQEEQKIRPLTDELLNHEFIAREPEYFKYMSYDDNFENYKPRYKIEKKIVNYKKAKYPKGDYLKTEGKITMNIRDNRMINALFDTKEEVE